MKGLATESILSKDRQAVLIMELQEKRKKTAESVELLPRMLVRQTPRPNPVSARPMDTQRPGVEVELWEEDFRWRIVTRTI